MKHNAMTARKLSVVADLKKQIEHLEQGRNRPRFLPLGVPAIDRQLAGGLIMNALHEASGGAALLFFCCVLTRIHGPLLWCSAARAREQLYPPGLLALGLDPTRFIIFRAHKHQDLLCAFNEGLRCAALGAVVVETQTPLDLTSARQLQLAAQKGQTPGFVINRRGPEGVSASSPSPSGVAPCAHTRWQAHVIAAPHWPGSLRLFLQLMRNRGGRPCSWTVDIHHDHKHNAMISGAFPYELPSEIRTKCHTDRNPRFCAQATGHTRQQNSRQTLYFSLVSTPGGGAGDAQHAPMERQAFCANL